MADEILVLRARGIPLSDDDVDAACEAVGNGLTALTLMERDEPADPDGTIVLSFRLSPAEAEGVR
jgi:hypothetical protein